jgi:hypothetical protein
MFATARDSEPTLAVRVVSSRRRRVHHRGGRTARRSPPARHPARVPIATSPGRAGFDVTISLNYDEDRTEDGTAYRVEPFRPRVEGLFARIKRWTERARVDVHWRATTRDNVTSTYGLADAARIADPDRPERVFSWLLEETRDDRGNVVRYHYKAEDRAGVDSRRPSERNRFFASSDGTRRFRSTAQRYLKRIEYGNHQMDDDSGFLFEIVLDYGEHDTERPTPVEDEPWPVRSDPFSSYRAGLEVRTYRLCRRVLVFHRFPAELGPDPYLVRSTDLGCRERPVVTYPDLRRGARGESPLHRFDLKRWRRGQRRRHGHRDRCVRRTVGDAAWVRLDTPPAVKR